MKAWGSISLDPPISDSAGFIRSTGWVDLTPSGVLTLSAQGPHDPEGGRLLLTFGSRNKSALGMLLLQSDAIEQAFAAGRADAIRERHG